MTMPGRRARVSTPFSSRGWRAISLAVMVAFAVVTTSFTSAAPSSADKVEIIDNETVYALMDATGSHRKTIVVNWTQVHADGTVTIEDPADVRDIESLTDGFVPEFSDGAVRWTADVDGSADFFYRAETDKPLPVELSVAYELDGRKIAPEELPGASGRLRIEISVTNKLHREEEIAFKGSGGVIKKRTEEYWVPLLCIAQVKLDGTRFTNVEAGDAPLTITGDEMSYMLMMFPQGEDSAAIEMDGRDIEIQPVVVTVFPSMPDQADLDFADDFEQMREGLDGLAQLSEGHISVLDGILAREADLSELSGLETASEDFAALAEGVGGIRDGAEGLSRLSSGQKVYLDGVIGGIDTSCFDDIGQLQDALGQLAHGIGELKTGTDGLLALLDGQIALMQQLRASNATMLALAEDRAMAYPIDATSTALAIGLAQQQELVSVITSGGVLADEPVPGLDSTREGLADISAGLEGIHAAVLELETEAATLQQVPTAFRQIKAALVVLRDGGTIAGERLPGLDETSAGLRDLSAGLCEVESGLVGATAGLAELESLPAMLRELFATLQALKSGGTVQGAALPGIDTTVEGLEAMSSEVAGGVDGARAGEVLTEKMERAAKEYDTFLGKPEGAQGNLNFLLRVDGIEKGG